MVETVAFIRKAQQDWFDRIRPYLLGANLNVGSGHGFFSRAARQAGVSMTSLDVAAADGAVEAAIAMYVLHHTPDPALVLGEMKRVASRRLILVEELYRHLPGKLG